MAAVVIEFAQYGKFDSFSIVRSETPINVASLPVPIVENLKVMYYEDTSAVPGRTYYYRIITWRNGVSVVSDEMQVLTVDNIICRLSFSISGMVDARSNFSFTWNSTPTYGEDFVNLSNTTWLDIPSNELLNFGNKDFSIVHEVYLTTLSGWRILMSGKYYSSTSYVQYGFEQGRLYFSDGYSGVARIDANTYVTVNTWIKTELKRTGTTLQMLINDIVVATTTISASANFNFNYGAQGTRLFNITWSSSNSPILGRCRKFEVSRTL